VLNFFQFIHLSH